MRRLVILVCVLGLTACGSRFDYAVNTGWPVEEPPCCNSQSLP